MSENAVKETGAEASETQAEERKYVDVGTLDDPVQLRDILRNTEKFTNEKPEEKAQEDTKEVEKDSKEAEKGDEAEESDKKVNESEDKPEAEAEATTEAKKTDDEEAEEGDKEHGDEVRPAQRMRFRVGHLDEAEQKVLKLVSAGKMKIGAAQEQVFTELIRAGNSVKQAEEAVYGGPRRSTGQQVEEAPIKQEAPVSKAQESVTEAQKKVNELKTKLKDARGKYDVDAIEEVRDQLDEARWELSKAEQKFEREESQRASQIVSAHQQAVNASTEIVKEMFPEAVEKGSELFEAIADRIELTWARNPAFFQQEDWPELLAAAEAAKLGVIPSSKRAVASETQAAKRPQQPSPAKKVATKITPAAGTPAAGSTDTIKIESQEDIDRLMAAAGNDVEKLNGIIRRYGAKGNSILPLADALAA